MAIYPTKHSVSLLSCRLQNELHKLSEREICTASVILQDTYDRSSSVSPYNYNEKEFPIFRYKNAASF